MSDFEDSEDTGDLSFSQHAQETETRVAEQNRKIAVEEKKPKPQQAVDLPWYERLMQGIKDPFNAGAQLLVRSPILQTTQMAAKAANKLYSTKIGETVADLTGAVDRSVAERERQYQAARQEGMPTTLGSLVSGQKEEPGIDWWRGLGNIANPVNWIGGGGTGLGANMVRGAASSALTMPVTGAGNESDFWKQKAIQGGTGAAVAGVMTPIAGAVGRMISPKTSEDVKTLMEAGVTPTPGQALGGSAQRLEDAATSIPFLGDLIKRAQGRGIADFNTAVYQRALDPVGEKAPKIVGHEGVEKVADILGRKYDALIPNMRFVPDAQFGHDLAGLKHLAASLPDAQQAQFNKIIESQLGKAAPNGGMAGETLKGVLSTIRQKAKGYSGDASFDNRELGSALNELHDIFNRTLQRINPAQAAELKAIDTGWANYARIRQAAATQGAESMGGVFTPAQLSGAVKALDKSVGKGAFAKGTALLQDLSGAGKSVLSQKVPDSGTPLRTAAGWALGGGLGYMANAHPAIALGSLSGAALASLPYTKAGQKVISKVLTERPEMAPQLADAVRRAMIATAAPGSAMLLKDLAP